MGKFKVGDHVSTTGYSFSPARGYIKSIDCMLYEVEIYHGKDELFKQSQPWSFWERELTKIGDEEMHEFKVGDYVKVLEKNACSTGYKKGHVGRVLVMEEESCRVGPNTAGNWVTYNHLTKVKEGEMSKYDDLKGRIEALDDGVNKEADDLIQEITQGKHNYLLVFNGDTSCGSKHFRIYESWGSLSIGKNLCSFDFRDQCSKMRAFRKALMYLLDHSDIKKDDKSEEIAELKDEMKKLSERIEELS